MLRLADIPVEIFQHIISFLPILAITNLRLTCCWAERLCWHSFLEHFNDHWRIFQTRECLDVLMRLCQSRLREGIHTLRIGAELLDRDEINLIASTGHRRSHFDDLVRRQVDQEFIRWSGWFTSRLALAFQALPNLRRVEICLFDETHSEPLSFGARSLEQNYTNIDIFYWDMRDVFIDVIAAADASNTHLQEIAVLPFESTTVGLALSSFDFTQHQYNRFPSLFRSLRRLQLCLQMERFEGPPDLLRASGFLSRAINLRDLRIALCHSRGEGLGIDWYEDAGHGDALIKNLSFSNLESCTLQGLELSEKVIKNFVVANVKLKYIKLAQIDLFGYWRNVRNANWPGWDIERQFPDIRLEDVFENLCLDCVLL